MITSAGAVRLIDQVRVPEDFKGIADYLLGDVLLIPNLPNGIISMEAKRIQGHFCNAGRRPHQPAGGADRRQWEKR